jgi:hypothetical protein
MPYVGRERWVLGQDFLDLVKRLRDRGGRASDCDEDHIWEAADEAGPVVREALEAILQRGPLTAEQLAEAVAGYRAAVHKGDAFVSVAG